MLADLGFAQCADPMPCRNFAHAGMKEDEMMVKPVKMHHHDPKFEVLNTEMSVFKNYLSKDESSRKAEITF